MALLRLLNSGDSRTFSLERTFSIGRAPGNSLQISDDPAISREHATISAVGASYTLTDLGSSNGTHVERQGRTWQVAPDLVLQDGDVILIGTSKLKFEAGTETQVGLQAGEQTIVGRVIPPR
jgi:pSer/pThr/pTyr-binding forkhead associated (FHA) protein